MEAEDVKPSPTEHESQGEAKAEHKTDPMEHIRDRVLIGLNSNSNGGIKWYPYDEEGDAVEGYAPAHLGPFKLEFTKHMGDITIIGVLFFAVAMIVAQRVKAALHAGHAPRGALANTVEAVIVYIRDEIVVPTGGHHLGHYTPIFLTYFFFILVANLFGMVPEFGGATGNIGVTLGLAISVYAMIWILGFVNQGPANYLLHLVPPGTPWWLWPGMFFLELVSPLIKCFVLSVRLFANMIAGHLIVSNVLALGAFGGLMTPPIAAIMVVFGVPLALGVSILEVIVCFIQAYVFTLLAVIFIGAAVHPEH